MRCGYALRREEGLRALRFWIISAKARSASLASDEVGNALATSGSKTTTTLPAAYRDAYLLREARLKSYSGRISSASVDRMAPRLLSGFFIVLSFASGSPPRANNPDRIGPVSVHHCE